jgi:hypothetical protein
MQFMVFMIPAGYQPKNGKQQDFNPEPKRMLKMMEAMGKFNDELAKAGAVVSVDGLSPLAKGARLAYAGGKPTVTDGPAINAKEVVGGFWLVKAKSKQEVIDWWKRCPAEDGDVIEIRPIADMSDFPVEVQKALKEQGTGSKEQGGLSKTPTAVSKGGGTRAPVAGSKPPVSGTKAPGAWSKEKGVGSTAPGTWKKPKTRTKEQD